MKFKSFCMMLSAILTISMCGSSFPQDLGLSPEQQRLLNSLPASQRQAVLDQLRGIGQSDSRKNQTRTGGVSSPEKTIVDQSTKDKMPLSGPLRFEPRSTLVLTAKKIASTDLQISAIEDRRRTELAARMHARNPYKLDDDGLLHLPGIDGMSIAGLTEDQAGLRLSADPAMSGLNIAVTLLPLSPVGLAAVKPFGYELFERNVTATGESYGVPVPANYVVGPGDSMRVSLYGNRNSEFELAIERDGSIRFPDIGPISVAGLTFEQLKTLVTERVEQRLIGTQVSISMGTLRMIQVFLAGDVNAPGAYNVGSLSTITSVLTIGQGVATNGSLRRIELRRDSRTIGTLDLYDLLLRGDAGNDLRVQAGDVIFVPPVSRRVTVSGEVRRPAIYEFSDAASVEDVLKLAGGVLSTALLDEVVVNRINPDSGLSTISASVPATQGRILRLQDGDVIIVPSGISGPDKSVQLVGNVQRPGSQEWRPGLRLTDVLPSSRDLKPGSDFHYVLIRREPEPNIGPKVVSADLAAAWLTPGSIVDLALMPRDTIYVFDLVTGRSQFVEPIIEELRMRSSLENPLRVVSIGGSVNAAGRYPAEEGMRISDLVRASGGLSQSAFGSEAELTRYSVTAAGSRTTEILDVDLSAALSGDLSSNLKLRSFDYLNIREVPNWRDEEFIEITGEVKFPGRFPIRRGESLHSVIERAGGLTEFAYASGSILTRELLKERERRQIDELVSRLESDLASLSLADPRQADALSIGQSLLDQLRAATPVGRLVIDLDKLLSGDAAESSLAVRDGDLLRIPQKPQEVTVIGEVQYATSHLYDGALSRDEYILRSGGTTGNADVRRIYVVRANGEVVAGRVSRFFQRSGSVKIQPGDTIVVPLDTDRVRPLTLWTSVSQVVYNLAIAVTAVTRF